MVNSVILNYFAPVCQRTSWDLLREQVLNKVAKASGVTVTSIEDFCEEFGDDFVRLYHNGGNVPYSDWRWAKDRLSWSGEEVTKVHGKIELKTCIARDGYVFGPVQLVDERGSGNKLVQAFVLKGRVHGKYRQWHKSGKLRAVGTFEKGKVNGVWLDYNAEGAPVRFLVYNMASSRRNATQCAGRCVAAFSDVPYLSPREYSNYPKHSAFLSHMAGARYEVVVEKEDIAKTAHNTQVDKLTSCYAGMLRDQKRGRYPSSVNALVAEIGKQQTAAASRLEGLRDDLDFEERTAQAAKVETWASQLEEGVQQCDATRVKYAPTELVCDPNPYACTPGANICRTNCNLRCDYSDRGCKFRQHECETLCEIRYQQCLQNTDDVCYHVPMLD